MSTDLEALEAAVLKLAPVERLHLFERLVVSLDTDDEIDAAWKMEADRREAELKSGVVSETPSDEVFARLRARLARFDSSAEDPAIRQTATASLP